MERREVQELNNEEEAAAVQRSDYEGAAQQKTERLRLEQDYNREREDTWLRDKKIDMIVDDEDIARLMISKWTGIPVSRLLGGRGREAA